MKYIYLLFFASFLFFAEEEAQQDAEQIPENEYEEGCSNELDDDMDGDVDEDDSDCEVVAAFWDGTDENSLSPYLVWGIGIAILNSVGSDSGTGTATTD
tara:strand:+ start:225 stop:521 length:297 start_codon:yes stop_codon:yes gene_type:complete